MDTLLCNDDGGVIFLGASDTTDEVLAFHYGNFDNHYGDGTVAVAATNGRVYADTVPATLPTKFGSIGTPSTASGQTTYNWTPPPTTMNANVLLVAGGGATREFCGGGGGGGVLYKTNQTLNSASYTIKVGDGGIGTRLDAGNGYNTEGFGSTAIGGGGGQSSNTSSTGKLGGSGGGNGPRSGTGGSGTSGQGNTGGGGRPGYTGGNDGGSGGGGGASAPGTNGGYRAGGDGGDGLLVGMVGETYGDSGWFGGGGAGFGDARNGTSTRGNPGIGGGGIAASGVNTDYSNTAGDPHTGGGAGAGGPGGPGGRDGGSGIVAIRYIVDNAIIAAKVGVFNYVSSSEYTSTSPTLYSNDTSGDWVTVYEISNPSRDGSGRVQYSLNNSLALNSYPYTRIGYLLTHTFPGQSTIDWVFCTFDKWSSTITDLRVPDLVDAFTNQRNVTNLNVYSSNQTAQPNRNNVSGRLEIWSYDYIATQSGLAPAGSNTQYDYDDTARTTGSYGSFQCHDVTNGVTCLAWNRQALGNVPDIGIGNNVITNPFYDSSGNLDWTFAYNYNSDFNLKIMVM